MKRFVMFILVLALAIGSVMAADTLVTVGLDYGALLQTGVAAGGSANDKMTFNFTGLHASLYSYADEFTSGGFYLQTSFQTLASVSLTHANGTTEQYTVDENTLFSTSLINLLAGYTHRMALANALDLSIGGGVSYQMLILEIGNISSKYSFAGIGASVDAVYLLTPAVSINAGLTAHIGVYDISSKKVFDDIPVTVRPYIAAGFRF